METVFPQVMWTVASEAERMQKKVEELTVLVVSRILQKGT